MYHLACFSPGSSSVSFQFLLQCSLLDIRLLVIQKARGKGSAEDQISNAVFPPFSLLPPARSPNQLKSPICLDHSHSP